VVSVADVLITERLILRPVTMEDHAVLQAHTEAARAVVEHALGPLGLPEVLAEVDEGNAASVAVVKRLGMTAFGVVPGVLGPMTRYRRTTGSPGTSPGNNR
jgi:GNAT acetyltransferase-like protein